MRRYLRQQPVLPCTGCPQAPTCIQDHVTCGCSRSLYVILLCNTCTHVLFPRSVTDPCTVPAPHCPHMSILLATSDYIDATLSTR